MKNLLHIISSPMGNYSHSIQLGNAIIKKLVLKYPGSHITERNLIDDRPPYLDGPQIYASFKDGNNITEEERQKLGYSDTLLSEIRNADVIILGAPMYNFGIHATLKAYIDQIVRLGQTIKYQADGTRIGLLTDKTVYLAITAGGSYNQEFNPVNDYIVNHLTAILKYIGIDDIQPLIIEGTKKPDFKVDYDEICRNI
ncbi:NAD(P)H-dependent oxidoreductase [Pedobacter steynii]|nr:NAD(P)H-dependent oxidoreductase [Pedobacter steynii]NQX40823.1 NAD(P)H-dependent oxidoreductase [Pedobacter steynii]